MKVKENKVLCDFITMFIFYKLNNGARKRLYRISYVINIVSLKTLKSYNFLKT